MSKLEELIEKLCPNGVEYISLGDIYDFKYGEGNTIPTEGGDYPVYGSNGMVGWHNKFNSEDSPVIGHIGAYAGIVNWASGKHFVTYNGVICKHKNDNVNKRYAYHLLLMQNFGEKAKGGSQPFVSYDALKKPLVPVPPLEVQCEIIHILDDFTLLSAELSAELKARQQQYDYYEKLLFDFDINNLKYKQMKFEDIATFSQGIQVDVNKQYYEPFDNCVPFLRIVDFVNKNEPPRYIEMPNEKYIKNEKEMIMIRYGASAAGKVFINKYGAIANNMFKINLKENCGVNLKYLMYYLSQKSIYNLLNNSGKSTMPAINFGFLGKLVINIPEKEEQDRIVKILDRFDKLCNDISEGLPAEIEKRQKQYEYYRDKLLTFKELKNE